MSTILHNLAQADTPHAVEVPPTWSGLAIWALGRFGGILVATAFLAYAWNDSNQSHKAWTERTFMMLEAKSLNEAKLAAALAELSKAIDAIAQDAREAHRIRP
jgi:hypothetical protein